MKWILWEKMIGILFYVDGFGTIVMITFWKYEYGLIFVWKGLFLNLMGFKWTEFLSRVTIEIL